MSSSNVLRELLLRDNNIYKAILSVESYLFNPQLLINHDIRLLNELNDKFNYDLLYGEKDNEDYKIRGTYEEEIQEILLNGGLIDAIKYRIKRVLDIDDFLFKSKVHLKVKDSSIPKYRPLHTTNLLDSIAIVSMLQVLIFDMKKEDLNTEIKLSNLSKLIPSNFFGNVPSKQPERLFEKWQVKYKAYTEKINEKFVYYKENGKYKTEVVLDLENFFPSINTGLVFNFVIESLKVKYSSDDLELMRKIVFKLLYFEIDNFSLECEDIFGEYYYKHSTEDYSRADGMIKHYLTKGIPQGLPQSYFFGNLIMISVSNIYKDVFDGESFFYVDDSVIYTNKFDSRDDFVKLLSNLNLKLKNFSNEVPDDVNKYLETQLNNIGYKYTFGDVIKVHKSGKSHYQHIYDSKYGYQYLKHLSRLASVGNFDINTTFDDHQEVQIKEKFMKIIEAIDKEINLTKYTLENLPQNNQIKAYCESSDCKCCTKQCILYNNYIEYIDKLGRFKRFFKYRVLLVNIQESKSKLTAIEKEVKSLDLNGFKEKVDNDLLEIKLSVISQYFIKYFDNGAKENSRLKNLFESLRDIELALLPNKNVKKDKAIEIFYFNTAFKSDKTALRDRVDRYKSLKRISFNRITGSNKHIKYQESEIRSLLETIQKKKIVEYTFGDEEEILKKFKVLSYWSKRSRYLRRQIYNTMISLILGIELNENMFISKKSKKLLNYYELRLAVAVRNGNVDTQLLSDILKEYVDEFSKNKFKFRIIDYSIYEAIHYFKTFAREAKYVDRLILVHKYTTELWENGSKYMHFYTLHNQSHAMELIVNINSILKSIDYLKISKFDYYILYVACYLHDISMVLYPDYDLLMKDSNIKANQMTLKHIDEISSINKVLTSDLNKAKREILELYKAIEVLFESEVRDRHARNSALFIRKSNDLGFLEKGIIDYVADVSYSHGMDAKDVFYLKSSAAERSVSLKFMMILIRLSDLLDMNENRVSVPIFHNNKDKMSERTRFHWISHLVTGRYEFNNKYRFSINTKSYLEPGAINELITLNIDVKINQLTSIKKNKTEGCKNVCMVDYKGNDQVILKILNHGEICKQSECNFVCKWFNKKNNWLIHELTYLQEYLGDVDGYFDTKFRIVLNLSDNNILRSEDFDDLSRYINR